jgi:hypothetical protein
MEDNRPEQSAEEGQTPKPTVQKLQSDDWSGGLDTRYTAQRGSLVAQYRTRLRLCSNVERPIVLAEMCEKMAALHLETYFAGITTRRNADYFINHARGDAWKHALATCLDATGQSDRESIEAFLNDQFLLWISRGYGKYSELNELDALESPINAPKMDGGSPERRPDLIIRAWMKRIGLKNIKEAADELLVSPTVLRRLMKGERRCSRDKLESIAKQIGCDASNLDHGYSAS